MRTNNTLNIQVKPVSQWKKALNFTFASFLSPDTKPVPFSVSKKKNGYMSYYATKFKFTRSLRPDSNKSLSIYQ